MSDNAISPSSIVKTREVLILWSRSAKTPIVGERRAQTAANVLYDVRSNKE